MGAGKVKLGKRARSESMWGYLMVAPTVIGLLVLNIYPFLDTIKLSTKGYKQITLAIIMTRCMSTSPMVNLFL